jgi:beta-lactamase regulating signal transducer with metallopeptidase domain
MLMAAGLLFGALKVLCLLVASTILTFVLRPFAARARAVVWQTALIGALLIPVVAAVLPPVALPVPTILTPPTADPPTPNTRATSERAPLVHESAVSTMRSAPAPQATAVSWSAIVIALWLVVGAGVLTPFAVGLFRVRGVLRRAEDVTADWRNDLEQCLGKCSVARPVVVLESDEIQAPATVGVLRPKILVPSDGSTWDSARRQAVTLHELIHIRRFDWPIRVLARVSRALYWFNPLSWWAVRRLDLEQEKACDDEVVGLGLPSSVYAEHLLGIAHTINRHARPALAGLTMAHRSHLEERIMSILGSKKKPRSRLATVIPAFLCTAAMVPALAAVYPADPTPRPASSELRAALDEMRELERQHEPELERIHEVEALIEAEVEKIHDIEIDIDHGSIAEIEERMRPYLEQIEDIEIDMEPYLEQIEQLTEQLDSIVIHVDDGTMHEIHEQVQKQIQAHMAQIEDIHVNLEPYMEQIERVHVDMEHLHKAMQDIHVNIEPKYEELEKLHESLEPFHEQMEKIHESMGPIHEQMELVGERIERAIVADVAAALRSHLDPVTTLAAPFDEAARRLVEIGNIRVYDNTVELDVPPREAGRILSDLLSPHRVGMQDAFDKAVQQAAEQVSELRIVAR